MPSASYNSSSGANAHRSSPHASASRSHSVHGGRAYDYSRGVSPPRCHAEQPRSKVTTRGQQEYRSVSPLGSSRFEQPSPYTGQVRRSATVSGPREMPRYGQDGYYGSSVATKPFQGAGLSRSNAVRSRDNDRGFGKTAYAGGGLSRSNAVYGRDSDRGSSARR
jgi:hypothetical protein